MKINAYHIFAYLHLFELIPLQDILLRINQMIHTGKKYRSRELTVLHLEVAFTMENTIMKKLS